MTNNGNNDETIIKEMTNPSDNVTEPSEDNSKESPEDNSDGNSDNETDKKSKEEEEAKEITAPKLVNKPVNILPLSDLELQCDKDTEAFAALKVFLTLLSILVHFNIFLHFSSLQLQRIQVNMTKS